MRSLTLFPGMDANKRLAVKLGLAATLMFGFGYALSPFYNAFCDALGVDRAREEIGTGSHFLRLELASSVQGNLPVTFEADQNVHMAELGKYIHFTYHLKNLGDQDLQLRAIPQYAPMRAAASLQKIKCFCMDVIKLPARSQKDVEVVIHVAKEMPDALDAATLNYTLYKVEG
ncbi:cytochrome c oxidase assembly protein [Leeia oryzae]|uniref:cytochrome c oxidase assembly protein n=1 Tax=Leeia oryzae TaxID=356662 RepID=UPI0003801210|nr:cytochrome c oxidase assembly protein [Leeia oryzae]